MDDRQEAILMFRNDVDMPTIASELGVDESTVYRWLNESGTIQDAKQDRNALIVAAYQQDWPIHRICTKFEVSQGTIYNILHSNEIPLRRGRASRSTADNGVIVNMYTSGSIVSAIRARTGRSLSYIYDVLARHDIPLRRPSRSTSEHPLVEPLSIYADKNK